MKLTNLCLFVVVFSACRGFAQYAAGTPQQASTVLSQSSDEILAPLLHATAPRVVFHTDDQLSVRVFGIQEFLNHQRIADDGSMTFPLIGRLQVSGLTLEELQALIAEQLRTGGFIRDPQVTVIADARPSLIVTVSGLVAKPGVFPAVGSLTLSDFISAAGGLLETVPSAGGGVNSPASSIVTLIRPSLGHPVTIALGPNPTDAPYSRIPVFAGDEIRVGKVGMVYAVGALKNQGGFALKNSSPTTVGQLVALAGGIGFEAAAADGRIVRTVNGTKQVISVNVHDILRGRAQDVALMSDDILFVPTNSMRAAVKGGAASLIVSIASSYLYAVR